MTSSPPTAPAAVKRYTAYTLFDDAGVEYKNDEQHFVARNAYDALIAERDASLKRCERLEAALRACVENLEWSNDVARDVYVGAVLLLHEDSIALASAASSDGSDGEKVTP